MLKCHHIKIKYMQLKINETCLWSEIVRFNYIKWRKLHAFHSLKLLVACIAKKYDMYIVHANSEPEKKLPCSIVTHHYPWKKNSHENLDPVKILGKGWSSSGWHAAASFGLLTFDLKVRWGYGASLTLTWGHSLVLYIELLHEGD